MIKYRFYLIPALILLHIIFCNKLVVAEDYFWIGGSGNWSDINHWSKTSGGSILHIQIPTSADNVIFDANSFTAADQTITVNTENAICRNMDWTGAQYNPVFMSSTDNNLRVYGSVKFIENMVQEFYGTFSFEGTQLGNTIESKGHPFLSHLIFDGIGGGWTILDTLRVQGSIYLDNGTLSSNHLPVECTNFISSQVTDRTLIITDSKISLNGSWNVIGQNLNLQTANSLIELGGSMSSTDGDTLFYHRVKFLSGGILISSNVYSVYQSAIFINAGLVNGTAKLDTVLFQFGAGTILGEITAQHTTFAGLCTIEGTNIIGEAFVGNTAQVKENNTIGFMDVLGKAKVTGTNFIQRILVADSGYIGIENTIGYGHFKKTTLVSGNNEFEHAVFLSDGHFFGSNEFDTLTFSPGFRYFLQHGTTTTINKQLNLQGNCQEPIFIKSDYNGLNATMIKTTGNGFGEYLSLRDIHALGAGGNFTAAYSVDLGNNDGWTIVTSSPKDLYWVGGQGEWSDTEHWSETSGGPGGACPPTEVDNVFFDAPSLSSGDSVIINSKNSVCYDMDWTGSAAGAMLYGPDTNFLNIYGSLTFTEAMVNSFEGVTQFEAITDGHFIDLAGQTLYNNVKVQGRGGEWALHNTFSVIDTFYFEHGTFNSNFYNIEAGRFFSADTNHRALYLNTDTLFTKMVGIAIRVGAKNLTIDADSSVIVAEANYAEMEIFDGYRIYFNNVHFLGGGNTLTNNAYGIYNLVTFQGPAGLISRDCTIDTAIFVSIAGKISDRDTIKTAIFYDDGGLIEGEHIIEIAYFYGTGEVTESNKIDTALFYSEGHIVGENIIDTTIIYDEALIHGENIIRTATLKERGEFKGENTFSDLFLEYQKSYVFEHAKKQIIIDTLLANGRCTGPIFLFSDVEGLEAGIEKINGVITLDYANIRDMHAYGSGLPYLATNSIDLGGNSGWDIYQPEAKALFWVGGKGSWSDSLHWAPVSGGQPGYCIPTPIDDVYFDHNSFEAEFDTVFIDVNIAACRSMYWTGADFYPTLSGEEDNDLYIYGSLSFTEAMQQSFEGEVHFASHETGNYVFSKTKSFNNNVLFEGKDGSWELLDSIAVSDTLNHVHGTLKSNGYRIHANFFLSVDSNYRILDLDTTTIYVNSLWHVNNQNLIIDADSTLIISNKVVHTTGNDVEKSIRYNDVILNFADNILISQGTYCYFDDVTFLSTGSVSGQCTIDSLLFYNHGSVGGTDTINYCQFYQNGNLNGGFHQVNTAIFDGVGNISGNCTVLFALFNSNGSVAGSNVIDTTIFNMNGHIQGSNVFNSEVIIYGDGTMVGENLVNKNLTIHGVAAIFENNLIYNALLLGWGYLGGPNVFNILSFTPGNTYTLTASTQQTIIDTLNIRGNNCFPITLLSSSISNIQAGIFKSGGEISGDFIIMKNIEASGGADFYAGGHSDDISNNSGWIWDNAPGYIFGLGEDIQYICEGATLILSTENFNGNSNTIYEWDDGSTGPFYEVTEAGVYGLNVVYSADCTVPGQITVEMNPSPTLDLGPDGELCEGTEFFIPANPLYETYLWSDSTQADNITVYQSGMFWLEVTNEFECLAKDSIYLSTLPAPYVDLGPDQILYNGDIVKLDAGYPGGTYDWSNGETSQTIMAQGIEGGQEYWVEVFYAGCTGIDTVVIDEYPSCAAQVPTAFSPNGDGTNDTLYVYGSGINTLLFQVFNRWGDCVFETDQITKGWDGNTNEQKQENEVYLYYLKAICFDGVLTEKKGNITLIR